MDREFDFPTDAIAKIAVGLVLLTMGVLVVLAILSFMGNETPLDDKTAEVIQAAADAAAGGE